MTLRDFYERELGKVSAKYGVSVSAMKKGGHKKRAAAGRTLVLKAMREYSPHSLNAIAAVVGVTHTSVLRLIQKDTEQVVKFLVDSMTVNDRAAAKAASEAIAAAELEAQKQIAEAKAKVAILAEKAPAELKFLASECPQRRRFGVALMSARKAGAERGDIVFQKHMREMFPMTWQTPSALYGPQEVRP